MPVIVRQHFKKTNSELARAEKAQKVMEESFAKMSVQAQKIVKFNLSKESHSDILKSIVRKKEKTSSLPSMKDTIK